MFDLIKNIYSTLHSIGFDGSIASIDKLSILFVVKEDCVKLFFNHFNKEVFGNYINKIRNADYRFNKSIHYNGTPSKVILHYNQINNTGKTRNGLITLNPNKHFDSYELMNDLMFIASISEAFEIHNIDLAIDINVPKNMVHFDKVGNRYLSFGDYTEINEDNIKELISNLESLSSNNISYKNVQEMLVKNKAVTETEYLGAFNRQSTFNYKLYDKQTESNLDVPLTRIEISIRFDSKFKFNVDKLMNKFIESQSNYKVSGLPIIYINGNSINDYSGDTFYKKYANYIRLINQSTNPIFEVAQEKNDYIRNN